MGRSLVQTRSLMPTGTPASGPGSSPAAIVASTRRAAARAWSGAGVQKACRWGSTRSMWAITASATSTAEISFARTRAASVTASMRHISFAFVM